MSFLCNAVLVDVQSHASLEQSCLKFSCCRQIPAHVSLMREGKGRYGMKKKETHTDFFQSCHCIFVSWKLSFLISLLKLVRELAENAVNTL